jgi:predicted transcriptional regulator
MVLELTLPAQLEERLRQEAERRGRPAAAVALEVLEQHLPPPLSERQKAALALLQRWMEEDAAAGDSEEADAIFRELDADRTSNRPLFPPELKGITW